MDLSLADLEEGLRKPFALEEVKFLPKSPTKKENGEWVCLALPYSDKRAYEDRLNDLAFGHWSTPPSVSVVAGNKLVIPVTVVLCGVAHTDYGEAFLTSQSRTGELREEENSATEGYSQAFRRACAQFRLGRYYYDLPRIWVPYHPQKRLIALDEEKKRALAERLYREAGLLAPIHALARQPPPAQAKMTAPEEAVTAQQQASLEKLCQQLNKPVPVVSSARAAKDLLFQLTREYQALPKAARQPAAQAHKPEKEKEATAGEEAITERLNTLYPRARALKVCTDATGFLKYASQVLKVRVLSAGTLTQSQVDLIEKDLVAREQQKAAPLPGS
jgi:hypothetical protein